MAIKSKDCVDALVAEYPDTKASQWKRKQKIKLDDAIFRIFENTKTGAMINVIEAKDKLTVDECDSQPEEETQAPVSNITVEELAQKILDATEIQLQGNSWGDAIEITHPTAVATIYECDNHGAFDFKRLTKVVEKDISKVEFDCENVEWEIGEGYGGMVGFRTLSNGKAILGIDAGGDWEQPLHYIIYWDGTQLRGYVPTDGNPYNTSTNTAYGNDEVTDDQNAQQRFGKNAEYTDINPAKVELDILANI